LLVVCHFAVKGGVFHESDVLNRLAIRQWHPSGRALLVDMMSDIAVASDRAEFRIPELMRSIADATYAAVLPAHVGIAVARVLLLSGPSDAEEPGCRGMSSPL
jgi:hypothetical protein